MESIDNTVYHRTTRCLTLSLPGSAVLVVTSTDVDKTGSSYYGEQGLLYLSARGDGNLVILDKKGPIYDVQWHPNSEEFCVLYGCIRSLSLSHIYPGFYFFKHLSSC